MTLPLKLFWEEILCVIIYVGNDIYKDTYLSQWNLLGKQVKNLQCPTNVRLVMILLYYGKL